MVLASLLPAPSTKTFSYRAPFSPTGGFLLSCLISIPFLAAHLSFSSFLHVQGICVFCLPFAQGVFFFFFFFFVFLLSLQTFTFNGRRPSFPLVYRR